MTHALEVALVALALVGCRERGENQEAQAKAERIWRERCVACHGPRGRGDGEKVPTLKAKPRDFSDPEWQRSEEDEELGEVIVGGGVVEGYSAEMPPNPDLASDPETVRALVRIVRSFSR